MRSRDKKKEIVKEKGMAILPYVSVIIILLLTTGATILFYENAVKNDNLRFEKEVVKINSNLEKELLKTALTLKGKKDILEAENVGNLSLNKISLEDEKDVGFLVYTGAGNITKLDLSESKVTKSKQNIFNFNDVDLQKYVDASKSNEFNLAEIKSNNSQELSDSKYILFLPIYEKSGDTNINLKGFIYKTLNPDKIYSTVYKDTSQEEIGLNLKLKDEKIFGNKNLAEINELSKSYISNISGLEWTAEYFALPTFWDESNVRLTFLIPILGIILAVLFFGLLRIEVQSKLKLACIAEELNNAESENLALFESEQKARKLAESSNSAKDEFISLISHEIRTPLNAIIGWSRILMNENITKETKQKALDTISKNVRIQSDIIDELLLFSNLSTEDKSLELNKTKISEVIDTITQEIEPEAREKNIQIKKVNYVNNEEIYCDEPKIKKAIKNLLQNAIKFTPRGGAIEFSAYKTEDILNLKVKDTGKGINKEFLPHIFERFKQADSSTTRNFGGLGLGLAISKQIINLHGGKIDVKSDGNNKGTEFEVKLPSSN